VAIKGRQRGFSLIEVIVTMGIMSFGLLGIAGMQLSAMTKSRVTFERNQATLLANDLVERIRANLPAAEAGSYDLDARSKPGGTATGCKGEQADCSSSDMATADLADWSQRVDAVLNDATAAVDVLVVGGTASAITVTLNWGSNQMTVVAEI
jgi:type IV pilus assembly protein PilV